MAKFGTEIIMTAYEKLSALITKADSKIDELETATTALIETGTFTPVIYGDTTAGTNTYSMQLGNYTKIGNRVFFDINLAMTAKDVNMAGGVSIDGLPYQSKGGSAVTNGSCYIGITGRIAYGDYKELGAVIMRGTRHINLYFVLENSTQVRVPVDNLNAAFRIYISGNYEINTTSTVEE